MTARLMPGRTCPVAGACASRVAFTPGLWLVRLPAAFLYLLWRSRRQPAYREHWAERLGWRRARSPPCVLWFHLVSVGETRARNRLSKRCARRCPTGRCC
ncbi:MAG: glycosyltransferase N-terminal domain-containing protein [Burkholderiaceae bacterium]